MSVVPDFARAWGAQDFNLAGLRVGEERIRVVVLALSVTGSPLPMRTTIRQP
jgi:hypothetical protein